MAYLGLPANAGITPFMAKKPDTQMRALRDQLCAARHPLPGNDLERLLKADTKEVRARHNANSAEHMFADKFPGMQFTFLRMGNGVLRVRCQDASATFEVDQRLREGLEAEFVKAAKGAFTKIKVVT